MKIKWNLLGILFLLGAGGIHAQSTALGNGWAPGRFLGWNATNGVNPLNFRTNNVLRMQMNGNIINSINAQPAVSRNGFVGLGEVPGFYQAAGGQGPFSLLHLNGLNFLGGPQTGGYRNWMRYGITSTHNQDLAFMGQRSTGGNDITDVVFAWSDNGGSGFPGPDNMVFSFLAGTGASNNDLSGDAPNGREIVRYKATGEVGVGPRFSNGFQPQSTLHQHQENASSSWMQITNQYMNTVGATQTGPTAITAANGLRMGIVGSPTKIQNGDALIYNQENRHLIFSTNHSTPANMNTTNERMRISALSAPTKDPSNVYVTTYNPGGILLTDATRIGVSYLPSIPVTAPLSLMHLGGNTSPSNDGWRNWMDIGTFVNIPAIGGVQGGHFYSGMRFAATTTSLTAVRDAVINWGFQPSSAASVGNKLRFIFTTPNTSGGLLSSGANGLEAGHFTSDGNNTRLGIGNFAVGDPNNTCEIKASPSSFNWPPANPGGASGLRLTYITTTTSPIPNPGQGVLSVNSNGDVIYVSASPSSSGCCLGNPCIGPVNPLTSNWMIPLATNNFFYVGNGGPGQDRVGIGFPACNPPPQARLHVMQNSGVNNDGSILSENTCIDGVSLRATATGGATAPQTKVAGWFASSGAAGAAQVAIYVPQGGGLVNIGYPTPSSVGAGGGLLNVNGNGAFNGDVIPVIDCDPSQRCGNPSNRWFEIWSCNGSIQTSDARLKENIKPLTIGMEQIMKLKPVTYTWKGNSNYGNKIGFVAQELKEVIGEVVKEGDDENKTLGVNYSELIPVLIKGMQEQQAQIDAKAQQNDDLKKLIDNQQKQIDELKALITSCCTNGNASGAKSIGQTNVELKDGDSVVLNQNVPNPFAEQTVISYNIPANIQTAQIIFYNNLGQVLKTVDIKTRGNGQLNVYANDLSNGVYSYSLIVDGKVADTKKMIKN